MAVELATAYISIIPSTDKIADAVKEALGNTTKPAQKQGAMIGAGLTKGINKVFKVGAAAVGGAAVAGLGAALVKGFQRLSALDQAKAKLVGLGHSASDVKKIMGNALTSVKGTAFGLDEAATVAASVVAAGIKPGKDLAGVLGTVADTATIAGSSMGDMGAIFGSVAARGKLQGDDLMQLQSRGVPVLQFLAKHYGITAKAASDMVSKGKVDFKNFEAAMKENLGGAAKKSGGTFKGAFANMQAAAGRLGASLLQGVFPQIKDGLNGLMKWFDSMGPTFDKLGKEIGSGINDLFSGLTMNAGDRKEFAGQMSGLVLVGARLRAAFDLVAGAAKSLFGFIGSHMKAVEVAASVLGGFVVVVYAINTAARIADAATKLWTNATRIWSAATKVARGVQVAWTAATKLAVAAGKGIWTVLTKGTSLLVVNTAKWAANTAAKVANGAVKIAGGLKSVASLMASLSVKVIASTGAWIANTASLVAAKAAQLGSKVATLAGAAALGVATAAQWAWNAAMDANPITLIVIAIAALVAGLVYFFTQTKLGKKIWKDFTKFISDAWNNIVSFFKTTFANISKWWTGLWMDVTKVVTGVWDGIKGFFQAALKFVLNLFLNWTIYGLIIKNWNAISKFFKDLWNGIKSMVKSAIHAVASTISSVVGGIKRAWKNAWNWVKSFVSDAFGKMLSRVRSVIGSIAGVVRSIKGKVVGALRGAASWLLGVGRNVINGLRNGITGAWHRVTSWVRGIGGRVRSAVGGLGSILWNAGSRIIQGFLNGIVSKFNAVKNFVGGIGRWIADHKGPKAYDLGLLVPNGGWIMQGLAAGLEKSIPTVQSSLSKVADSLSVEGPVAQVRAQQVGGMIAPAEFGSQSTGARGVSRSRGDVNVTINEVTDPQGTYLAVARRLNALGV